MNRAYGLASTGGKSLSVIPSKHTWRGTGLCKWRCYTAQPRRKLDDKKNEGYPELLNDTKLQGNNIDKVYQDGKSSFKDSTIRFSQSMRSVSSLSGEES